MQLNHKAADLSLTLKTKGSAEKWIADLARPGTDAFFMSQVFLTCMLSPDQETKQGCIIVDDKTKNPLASGFNGHPRKHNAWPGQPGQRGRRLPDLATKRPDKYRCIVHADANAAVNAQGRSESATAYLPMPPCEGCLGIMANMPYIRITRIVFLEYRFFPNTEELLKYLPHIKCEKYQGPHPADLLLQAAAYSLLRTKQGKKLSAKSTKTYSS